ncbi:hypothetical protein BS47DRAFT_1388609 [Hydnum rufescens UP504]|uniref:Uncharacterized protein n=1 Tax=Hydnum rufescens UP504 TaxID=1448309 RepID=A0A9P6E158_9AGAM|nr:hypothetical protein BS47DRAFT_1388609 [Hydnum rufescens UP504]
MPTETAEADTGAMPWNESPPLVTCDKDRGLEIAGRLMYFLVSGEIKFPGTDALLELSPAAGVWEFTDKDLYAFGGSYIHTVKDAQYRLRSRRGHGNPTRLSDPYLTAGCDPRSSALFTPIPPAIFRVLTMVMCITLVHASLDLVMQGSIPLTGMVLLLPSCSIDLLDVFYIMNLAASPKFPHFSPYCSFLDCARVAVFRSPTASRRPWSNASISGHSTPVRLPIFTRNKYPTSSSVIIFGAPLGCAHEYSQTSLCPRYPLAEAYSGRKFSGPATCSSILLCPNTKAVIRPNYPAYCTRESLPRRTQPDDSFRNDPPPPRLSRNWFMASSGSLLLP